MKKNLIKVIGILVLPLLLMTATLVQAAENKTNPAEYYKGKKIDYSIPSRPGGSIDLFGRFMASMLDRYLGTTSVIKTRRKGGGMEGYSHVYRAKPNGLSIGDGVFLVITLNEITGEPGAAWKMDKFNYIMGVRRDPPVMVVSPKGPYQSFNDLRAGKNLKLGAGSPSGNNALGDLAAIFALDLDAKMVSGYKGSKARKLAILQGELAGVMEPMGAALRDILAGDLKPLFIFGSKRWAGLPEVPAVTELITLQGEKRKMVDIWTEGLFQSWVLYTSPDTPKDRVRYLQEVASKKIMRDPEFKSGLKKVFGLEVKNFLSGDDLLKVAKNVTKDKAMLQKTFSGLMKKYRASFSNSNNIIAGLRRE